MKFLLINTSGPECLASVFKVESGEVFDRKSCEKNSHSERLFTLIDEVIDAAKLRYEDITNIAAIVGPGSFTGLRVSLAAVQGLRLASHISVHGVSLLELRAYFIFCNLQQNSRDVMAVIGNMQKEPSDMVFYQIFDKSLVPRSDLKFCPRSEVPVGNYAIGAEVEASAVYDAKFAGEYLVYKIKHGLPETPLSPIYSRHYA